MHCTFSGKRLLAVFGSERRSGRDFANTGIALCCVRNPQENLTSEGMRQGILDSDVFLLLLTEHVLDRPYCLMEIMHAIQSEKKIQLILEVDSRFGAFDVDGWQQSNSRHSSHVAGRDWNGCRACRLRFHTI
jgi:hypothetical protein